LVGRELDTSEWAPSVEQQYDLVISGGRVIDATGLVVAPGFIHTHFHAADPFATKLALRDGTTTRRSTRRRYRTRWTRDRGPGSDADDYGFRSSYVDPEATHDPRESP
jgi:predicted amidohydrolase YtcJ